MEIVTGVVVAIVFAGVGFVLGSRRAGAAARRAGAAEADARIRALAEALARGRRPEGPPGSPEADLHAAIDRGFAPREEERMEALREAVGRVAAFLDREVRAPLAGASDSADATELRERVARALGALQDVDFFLIEPDTATEGRSLDQLVGQVAREFANDQEVTLRLAFGDAPARADVNATALMDALYLILHNAARFGGGGTIDVSVTSESGRPRIVVRDRGPGFSEEAFARAFDPFYSSSENGLGLGLPHARKVVEAMGGAIELRNVPDGGAEVEVTFPASR